MPLSFVFHRAFMLGRYSLPLILTGNHEAAPSPFSRPMLWLVRLSAAYGRSPAGISEGLSISLRASGLRVPSAHRSLVYPLAPTPPNSFSKKRARYLARSMDFAYQIT